MIPFLWVPTSRTRRTFRRILEASGDVTLTAAEVDELRPLLSGLLNSEDRAGPPAPVRVEPDTADASERRTDD